MKGNGRDPGRCMWRSATKRRKRLPKAHNAICKGGEPVKAETIVSRITRRQRLRNTDSSSLHPLHCDPFPTCESRCA